MVPATATPVGRKAELKCIADGYPRPSIMWKREYDAIMPSGGHAHSGNVLTILSVSKADRGTYYCIAENEVGKADRKSVNFEVEFAPTISVPRPKVAQAVGYDIELECKVEAYPAPVIQWFKGAVPIMNDADHG